MVDFISDYGSEHLRDISQQDVPRRHVLMFVDEILASEPKIKNMNY